MRNEKILPVKVILELEQILSGLSGCNVAREKERLLDSFSRLLRPLDEDERKLILSLTLKFKHFTLADIETEITNFVLSRSAFFQEKASILIAPIIDDSGKVKGGSAVTSVLRNALSRHLNGVIVDTRDDVTQQGKPIGQNLVVLVDDFIGTGSQAENFLARLSADVMKKAVIFTVAIHRCGLESLGNLKIPIHYNYIYERGITDDPNFKLPDDIDKMRQIEKKIKSSRKYSLGYGECEALVAFYYRSPNNTFPIYWHRASSDYSPPFPRY